MSSPFLLPFKSPMLGTNYYFFSIDFSILDISYKLGYIICGLFWLASFIWHVCCFCLFTYFWLCWVFIAACVHLSSCGTRASLQLWHAGFFLYLWHAGSRAHGLCSCGVQAPECMGSVVCGRWALSLRRVSSVVVAQGLNCPTAMWDLSSPSRDQTCIPCIGRQILYHWTTRVVPVLDSFWLPDLCGYTIFHLPIHHLMNIWVISTLSLLWIMLLWTYKFLCQHVFQFSWIHI